METIHVKGMEVIESIQALMTGREEQLFAWSRYGDPAKLFVFYFPVLFCLSNKWGIRLMWIGVLGEWFNLCLKWLLHGERPYWYAVEYEKGHPSEHTPHILQFPMTCETGPGSPSGHAMITGAVWCVLIAALLRKLQKHILPGHEGVSRVVSAVVWAIFAVCYLLVCLSRLSLGAHFPHQIIAGAICGMVLVAGLAWIPITSMRTRNYVITSGVLFGLAYDEYLCIRCLGFNPDWSVVKALTFCKEQGWVNLNTAPLHSLARLCGALLGLGIGLNLRTWVSPIPEGYGQGQKRYRRPWDARMVTAVLAAGLYRYAESLPLPYEPMALFYVSAFVKHTIVPVLVVAVVPLVGDFIIRCFHHFPLHKRL